jgi:hypothetical protein
MKYLISLLMALTVSAVTVLPAQATGEFMTGRILKVGLEGFVSETSDELVRDAIAFGYVIGVHDALSGTLICSGDEVTQGLVIQAVLQYMRAHPETLDDSADTVVVAALKGVWPCRKS